MRINIQVYRRGYLKLPGFFTLILKPNLVLLGTRGCRRCGYLDNLLLMDSHQERLKEHGATNVANCNREAAMGQSPAIRFKFNFGSNVVVKAGKSFSSFQYCTAKSYYGNANRSFFKRLPFIYIIKREDVYMGVLSIICASDMHVSFCNSSCMRNTCFSNTDGQP